MFTRCFLSEVDNFDVAPMLFQILRHEPPMAVVRLILAAQQTPVREEFVGNGCRGTAGLASCYIRSVYPVFYLTKMR